MSEPLSLCKSCRTVAVLPPATICLVCSRDPSKTFEIPVDANMVEWAKVNFEKPFTYEIPNKLVEKDVHIQCDDPEVGKILTNWANMPVEKEGQ